MTRIRQQLNLEALEDRRLLATCNVVRLGDFGAGGTMGSFSRGDLRFCINHANENPGPDTILFQVNGTIDLTGRLPHLGGELTITGPGVDKLTIDAQQKARIFYVETGASVGISGLTITGGFFAGNPGGGGVYNEGDLTLQNCSISANAVDEILDGNGVYRGVGGGIYNLGTLSVINSTISGNNSKGHYASAGGIYNQGTMLIASSLISNNSLTGLGGLGGVLGGGIYNNQGKATIVDTAISWNLALEPIFGYGYGGGIFNYDGAVVTLRSSLIANNSVFGDTVFGGGIVNIDSEAAIINSTVSDNVAIAVTSPADGGAYGGAIYSDHGPLTIRDSIIAGNRARGLKGALSIGGGISNFDASDSEVTLYNTIVADNIAQLYADLDIYRPIHSMGYNLIGNSTGSSGYAPSDILNVDPLLGPLQNNGGPTQTMALLPGSPAIDAGDPNPTDPPEWDQRGPGFPRIVNDRIDIGAFEEQATGISNPSRQILSALVNSPNDLLSPANYDRAFDTQSNKSVTLPAADARNNSPAHKQSYESHRPVPINNARSIVADGPLGDSLSQPFLVSEELGS